MYLWNVPYPSIVQFGRSSRCKQFPDCSKLLCKATLATSLSKLMSRVYLTRFFCLCPRPLLLYYCLLRAWKFTTRRSMDTKPSGLVSMYSLSRQTFGCCDGLCGSFFVGLDTSARALHFSTFQITRMIIMFAALSSLCPSRAPKHSNYMYHVIRNHYCIYHCASKLILI